MPSKDTIPFKITLNTRKELDRIREVISKELNLDPREISLKQAEVVLRVKAIGGKITITQIKDILIGKLK